MTPTPTDQAAHQATDARVWTVRQYLAHADDAHPDDARPQILAALRDTIRTEGFTIAEDTLTHDDGTPVRVNARGDDVEPAGGGFADGTLYTWTVQARHFVDHEPAVDPTYRDAHHARYTVPESLTAHGGSLRVHHGYGGPVTVRAWGPEEPNPSLQRSEVGYRLTAAIDSDTEVVELLPGAHLLTVHPDPEDQP